MPRGMAHASAVENSTKDDGSLTPQSHIGHINEPYLCGPRLSSKQGERLALFLVEDHFPCVIAAALLCAPSIAFAETCVASHYGVGDGYGGRRTANREIMNPHAMTAAHRTLPFGSHVTVTHLGTGQSVSVRINDRGPFVRGRCMDLSYGAARALGMSGTAKVLVR